MADQTQSDLWAAPTATTHETEIRVLVPVARDLARRAGQGGITVSDLRLEAQRRNLIPQQVTGRQLSYLGAVMKAAGLVATGAVRRSTIVRSHGNRHTVWVLP